MDIEPKRRQSIHQVFGVPSWSYVAVFFFCTNILPYLHTRVKWQIILLVHPLPFITIRTQPKSYSMNFAGETKKKNKTIPIQK